ncbi:DUF887-domain-containing protein [Amylostereum chailletii]|nr:DUF887-domain-containing protein [Amylostereum chailletii]
MGVLAPGHGLQHLPDHAKTLALSFASFALLQLWLSPTLSRVILGPQKWKDLGKRTQGGWNVRVASTVHALLVVPLAVRCFSSPVLDMDRAFGWDDTAGALYAMSCGYFAWDTLTSIVQYEGIGFVVHGVVCLAIYLMGFRPFLAYYGTRFLLWELSTPFLNIHWFLDKTGRTGSVFQLLNGAALISTFASVRLVYGGIMSYQFYQTIAAVKSQIPPSLFYAYAAGNIVLQGLNWFWFTRMIAALRKRFSGPTEKRVKRS